MPTRLSAAREFEIQLLQQRAQALGCDLVDGGGSLRGSGFWSSEWQAAWGRARAPPTSSCSRPVPHLPASRAAGRGRTPCWADADSSRRGRRRRIYDHLDQLDHLEHHDRSLRAHPRIGTSFMRDETGSGIATGARLCSSADRVRHWRCSKSFRCMLVLLSSQSNLTKVFRDRVHPRHCRTIQKRHFGPRRSLGWRGKEGGVRGLTTM